MSDDQSNAYEAAFKSVESFASRLELERDDRINDAVIANLIKEHAMTGNPDVDRTLSKMFICCLLMSRGFVEAAIAFNKVDRVSEVKT